MEPKTSGSTALPFNSKRARPSTFRTLQRGARWRLFINPDDLSHLWATYRKGGLALPAGLSADEFDQKAIEHYGKFTALYTLTAPTKYGADWPVGIVGVVSDGYRAEINVTWLAPATTRNKLETMVRFLRRPQNRYAPG